MRNILIITDSQFGYNSDLFYYSKYLAKHYNVTFIGINHGFQSVKSDFNLNLVEIKAKKNTLINKFNLLVEVFKLNRLQSFQFIFVLYFPLCSFLQIVVNRHITSIDIRSSYILPSNKYKEVFSNTLLKIEYCLFENRTIISSSLADFLNIKVKYYVLPLGGELNQIIKRQNFCNQYKLLYIGTFYERDIYKTIIGFKSFVDKFPNIDISYTLIGFGPFDDINKIKDLIASFNIEDKVKFLGEIRYPESLRYFKDCNIGVSFVPCTPYYDCQPPTKTFEYLLCGMPVIATNTTENKLVINNENGVLTNDNPIDFCSAIEMIIARKYKNIEIQEKSLKYSWEYIVENKMIPYIDSLINSRSV